MDIQIDEDACCGSGQCVLSAPSVFGQRDEDGIVFLLSESPAESERPSVEEATDRCPTNAIQIID